MPILADFATRRHITFPLLSDVGSATIKAFGILNPLPELAFGPDKAALAAFNPIARVPALQLGDGEMLIDSAAILDHR